MVFLCRKINLQCHYDLKKITKNVINQLLSLYFGIFSVKRNSSSWPSRVYMQDDDIITVHKIVKIYLVVAPMIIIYISGSLF